MKKLLCITLILAMCLGFSVIGFADVITPTFPKPVIPKPTPSSSATVSNPDGARCLNKSDYILESGTTVPVEDISKNDAGIIVVSVKVIESDIEARESTEVIYEFDITDFSGNAVRSYYLSHPGDLFMRLINIISDFFSSISERISGLLNSEA